ncbi:Hypothetical protein LUCI_0429 [Lucifera butyrica]|uniref:Xylose isomerase-like TIM barrel domain-containing protein n=1 Tax=Lucifera butyrica TaxID=1351585 RepID=A0A498R4M8_9FIRM|nr:TIM barrel protein [Lucifera butyrica]VBB05222.1 Hypothetical protein LUCI_0429 [Lucifera butyrica]
MLKSACIEMLFTEVPFYERFALAKEAGFDYVEFWSWTDKDIDTIKQLCDQYSLKIASFSGDKDFSLVNKAEKEAYIDFIKKSIKTAQRLHCGHLVIHSNALGEGGVVVNHYNEISDYEKFANMYDVLRQLAPMAEENKTVLVLEGLNIYQDHVGNFLAYTKDAVTLIQMVNSEYIKVLYDVYHMQINEGNIMDTLTKCIDSIDYIHIADVPGRHEPGTGEINFKNVMNQLRKLDYRGIVGFELSPSRASLEVVKELIKL